MTDRSSRAEVRNPVLALSAARALLALPPEAREALADVLMDLHRDAKAKAERSWKQKKAPVAVSWKATSVYAIHLARAVRPEPGETVSSRLAGLREAA